MSETDLNLPVMPLAPSTGGSRKIRGSRRLRSSTLLLDAVCVLTAWAIAMVIFGAGGDVARPAATLALVVVVHWLAFQRAGLYLARVAAIRLEEMTRVLHTVSLVGVGLLIVGRSEALSFAAPVAVVASALTVLLLFAQRAALRAWLLGQRAAGRLCRPVVIVGTNDEGAALYDLLSQHPELGYQVVGVYGDEVVAHELGLGELWRGDEHVAAWHVHAEGITGAIIAGSTMASDDLNRLSRELLAVGAHLQLSSRLVGFASHRLRSQSIAYEPVIYVEALQLARWQTATKRLVDIVLASLLLIPGGLLIALFAVLLKLEDRGPAIFRQTRVGRGGKPFKVLKLRTMVVDAEARLAELAAQANERNGPLFKMEHDPRMTRIGRFMDATSINELPQLWNVLRGDMSLIGPRPSLPAEYAEFDAALQARTVVRPGITGLWQVEARDNPSFDAYRRFDLHYVENWSMALDVVILAATAEAVIARLLRMARRSPSALNGTASHTPPRIPHAIVPAAGDTNVEASEAQAS